MRVVCAWCGTTLSGVEGPVSHGICGSCSISVERAFHRTLLHRQRLDRARKRRRAALSLTLPLPGFPLPEPA